MPISDDAGRILAALSRIAARERAVERIRAEVEALDLSATGALVLLYDDPERWEVRVSALVDPGQIITFRPDEIA